MLYINTYVILIYNILLLFLFKMLEFKNSKELQIEFARTGKELEELKKELEEVDEKHKELTQELEETDEKCEKLRKKYEKASKKFEKAERESIEADKKYKELEEKLEKQKMKHKYVNSINMTDEQVAEEKRIIKKSMKEEIAAMVVLKRADKRRYGNLQIGLKNKFNISTRIGII